MGTEEQTTDERAAFDDAVNHFMELAALVAVQIDSLEWAPESKNAYQKRLAWLVHTKGTYEAAQGK